jgi:hypothetical protein
MLKISSLLSSLTQAPKPALDSCLQVVRSFKTRGEYFRRFGYKYNQHFTGGLLPRPDPKLNDDPLVMPEYKSDDKWTMKKSTFGQNDYVDILGNGSVKPVDLIRGPDWLIGFKGNELQRLNRQMRFHATDLKAKNPNKFHDINKRIKYLSWRYRVKFGGLKK